MLSAYCARGLRPGVIPYGSELSYLWLLAAQGSLQTWKQNTASEPGPQCPAPFDVDGPCHPIRRSPMLPSFSGGPLSGASWGLAITGKL